MVTRKLNFRMSDSLLFILVVKIVSYNFGPFCLPFAFVVLIEGHTIYEHSESRLLIFMVCLHRAEALSITLSLH